MREDDMPLAIDWTHATAPTIDEIDEIAKLAYSALPASFRRLCDELVIQVEDFPDDATLDALGCESEFDLLGLFHGHGLAHSDAVPMTGQFPNMVWLYRRPILDFWADQAETLGSIITHVLVHEIGHHFGLSDEDMLAIEHTAE
jgi:predicted Zn-dependent protease with MMP-like domain